MKKLCIGLALAMAVAASQFQPALAQDNKVKIFAGASYISPLDEADVDIGAITDSIEASSELGWTVGVEFRFGEWIGLEVDYVSATHDIEFGGQQIAEIDFAPISASLNVHLVHTKLVDLYIAPTATYVYWGDLELDSGQTINLSDLDTDDEVSFGASLGLDIGLGEHFAVFGGVRWLSVDFENDDIDGSIGVDPLLSRLGVAVRF